MNDAVLAINAGSSSLKFAVFGNAASLPVLCRGEISGLGGAPRLCVHDGESNVIADRAVDEVGDDAQALEAAVDWLHANLNNVRFSVIGHRVVHGGSRFVEPVRVDEDILHELQSFDPLAPQHQPYNLQAIRTLSRRFGDVPQVACFDTAFHAGWNDEARRIAIPRRFHDAGIRRYGFHGLSYEFLGTRARALVPDARNVVLAHLGSGASVCAVHDGRSVDSSMGFSVLDGLPMATRCGSIDPGVIFHLQRSHALSYEQVEHLLYYESGLKGVSGISADMRELLASLAPAAGQAIDLFVYRCAQSIGALVATLGGLDMLVFSGGIGWHAPLIRERVCARLGCFGVRLGGMRIHADVERISAENALPVFAIKTDEERVIAGHCLRLLAASDNKHA